MWSIKAILGSPAGLAVCTALGMLGSCVQVCPPMRLLHHGHHSRHVEGD